MITVMGATGQVGSKVTRLLLDRGHEVRALGRSPDKLADLAAAGAEVRTGDAVDPTWLAEAFRGSDAVLAMLPFNPSTADHLVEQAVLGGAIVAALRAATVDYVVNLSSLGAEQPTGHGLIASLHEQEQRLQTLTGTNVLSLRPASYFENFHAAVEVIREHGVNVDSVDADLPLPMIATRDVAQVAADALVARDWTGFVVRELLGQRDLSHTEVTAILGARIGQPDLRYVQLPYDEMAATLEGAGLSASYARGYVDMTRAFNEGRVVSGGGRTQENTTPTRFEEFAATLALPAGGR